MRTRTSHQGPVILFVSLALAGCGSSSSSPSDAAPVIETPDASADSPTPVDQARDLTRSPDGAPVPDVSAATEASPGRDGAGALTDAGSGREAGAPDAAAPDAADRAPDAALLVCGPGAVTSPAIKGPSVVMTDADQTFRSLVVDPTNADVVFVGSEGNGMFRTLDGGQSWTWLRSGLRYDSFPAYAETWDLAIAASNPKRIYAAMTDSPGPLDLAAPSARGGVYRSDDGGDTWRQVGCALPNAKTASVWVDPTNAEVVIAGLEGGEPSFMPPPPLAYYPGGLWKSTDGGSTWTALTMPAGADHNSYWRIARRSGTMWTVGLDGRETPDKGLGVLSSADGVTFTALATSFAAKLVTGWDVSPDGATILVSVRDTFKLQRSTNGGTSFAVVDAIASANANGPIAFSPADAKVVLFASNNQLHRSEDSLASSTKVLDAPSFVEDIEWAPSKPEVVYATVRGLRLFRSADGGKTWAPAGNLRADVIEKN